MNWGKKISFEQFDAIFKEVKVVYDKRYLESESSEVGSKLVNDNVGKVFEESEGAVVYKGEKVGLHTRVFINSRAEGHNDSFHPPRAVADRRSHNPVASAW